MKPSSGRQLATCSGVTPSASADRAVGGAGDVEHLAGAGGQRMLLRVVVRREARFRLGVDRKPGAAQRVEEVGERRPVVADQRVEPLGPRHLGRPPAEVALPDVARQHQVARADPPPVGVDGGDRQRRGQREVDREPDREPARATLQHRDRQHQRREMPGGRPVGVGPGDQRLDRDDREDRQRHHGQVAPRRIGPGPGDRSQVGGEEDRPRHAELPGEEPGEPHEVEPQSLPAGVRGGVLHGREVVRGIPDEVRRDERQRDGGGDRGVAPGDPRRRHDQRRQRRGEREVDHRVLGEEPDPHRRPQHERPGERAALGEVELGEERQGEAEEHRHVGRDEEAAERDAGEAYEGEAGEPADAPAVEPPGDEGDDHRRRRVDQRHRQPDPEWRIGADLGRGAQDPADQRRLRVVAPGELLPPEPVLGIVDEEVGADEGQERHPPEGDERDAGKPEREGPRLRPGAWRHGSARGCGHRR